jgi:4-amino-4-deoxy-L-arabinose transferase-like glycosyltransferase
MKLLTRPKTLLLLILLIACFLRIFLLDKFPAGLQVDEALIVYNAYTLSQEASDAFGNYFPVHLVGYGWGENAFLSYLLVLPIKIFGLSHFQFFRVIPVFFNLLLLLFIYLLVKELFQQKIALLTAFLLALSPWNIALARLLFNVSFLPLFFIAGSFFLIKGLKTTKNYHYFLAAIIWGLSFYVYASSFIWLPILLVLIVFSFKDWLKKIKLANYFSFFVPLIIIALPIFLFYLKNQFGILANLDKIAFFSLPNLVHTRLDEVSILHLPFYLALPLFIISYILHYNPYFLFFYGNSLLLSPHIGLVYLFEIPFICLGIILGLKNFKEPSYKFIILWLAFSALPAAFTIESVPHPLRFTTAMGLFEIFAALGFIYFWQIKFKEKRKLIYALSIFALINFAFFCYDYYVLYPKSSSPVFHYQDQAISEYIRDNYNNYDQFFLIKVPGASNLWPYNFLVYTQYPVQQFQAQEKILIGTNQRFAKLSFGLLAYFQNISQPKPESRVLYFYPVKGNRETGFLSDKKIIKEFYDLDGQVAVVAAKAR